MKFFLILSFKLKWCHHEILEGLSTCYSCVKCFQFCMISDFLTIFLCKKDKKNWTYLSIETITTNEKKSYPKTVKLKNKPIKRYSTRQRTSSTLAMYVIFILKYLLFNEFGDLFEKLWQQKHLKNLTLSFWTISWYDGCYYQKQFISN